MVGILEEWDKLVREAQLTTEVRYERLSEKDEGKDWKILKVEPVRFVNKDGKELKGLRMIATRNGETKEDILWSNDSGLYRPTGKFGSILKALRKKGRKLEKVSDLEGLKIKIIKWREGDREVEIVE